MTTCINCGLEGQHYMPPYWGEDGYFVCQPPSIHLDGCECRACLLPAKSPAFAFSSPPRPVGADDQDWLDYLDDHSPRCICDRCEVERGA